MNRYWFIKYLMLIVFFINCLPVGGIAGPRRSFPIKNQRNTFLILKIDDLPASSLSDVAQANKDSRSFYFYIDRVDTESTSWPKGLSYPLNPSHEFFRIKNDGLYKGPIWQFFSNNRREEFLFGCEYRFPLPSGISELSFMLFDYDMKKRGFARKKIDLPENHSIRVKALTGSIQSTENLRNIKKNQNWPSSYLFLNEQIFDLNFEIEETRIDESNVPCRS